MTGAGDLAIVWIGLASFGSGLVSTVAGMGGAVGIIAVLALFLPTDAVIVLTTPIILVGNSSRFFMFRSFLERPVLKWFLIGGIPAAIFGAILLPLIPVRTLELALAAFLLLFVLDRILLRRYFTLGATPLVAFVGVGAVAGLLSSTVGASGPFTTPFLQSRGLSRQRFVGTITGGTMVFSLVKLFAFASIGLFTLRELPILAVASAAIVAGNVMGKRLLNRLDQAVFATVVTLIIAFSAVRLLIS